MDDPTIKSEVDKIAKGGYYIALRVGYAYPIEEVNKLPQEWVDHYTQHGLMVQDPVIRWVYSQTGAIAWSAIDLPDPWRVMDQARAFGMRYGLAVVCEDKPKAGPRSFGMFARPDREFNTQEVETLHDYVTKLHQDKAPPTNLTPAELEALTMVRDGMRLKQIAHDLGISEGAVKQRLRSAKTKLGAQTSAQAAAMIGEYGF